LSGVADVILKDFLTLNEAQCEAIARTEGPLLVIAEPGSGKTLVLVLRTLNLLLQGLTDPEGILLCTFTEKAAFELRDRLSLLARKLKYDGNLTSLHVGTIHGLANSFLLHYRHHTQLGNNYEVLDELTQLLFIFDHFDNVIGTQENGKYLGRWSTRWTAIEGVRNYFNKITEEGSNIAVVGDEDQALYRFRGGTVRNILEFPSHFKKCHIVTLSVNYRSHKDIIEAYDRFMRSWDWSDSQGKIRFRFDKEIKPEPEGSFTDYPALFSIWGENKEDEARRFADLVAFLMASKVIEDESQVALLLHSVRQEHSGPYLTALAGRGIPAFCPRARAYFDNEEIRYLVGCYAILLGYYEEGRGQLAGHGLREIASYVDECLVDLGRTYPDPHPLAKLLQEFTWEIANLKGKQTLNRRLADYFYQFLAHEPFSGLVKNENRARNMAIFSQLLSIFQAYYHYTVITARNREPLRFHFFHRFLRLLYEGGINEYEDPDEPMPKGHVQVMTIHQAKGLEFPVVVVGSLAVQLSSPKDVDRVLGSFYHRSPFEPADRITGFDRMRLHYVAFSRVEKILALTTTDQPKPYFNPIWQGLPQWPYVRQDLLKSLFFRLHHRMPLRRTFSFTSDLKLYETCPRQYEFFRFYQFMPARSAEYFFGSLVHETIEESHRWAMDGKSDALNDPHIQELFQLNYQNLLTRGLRPIGPKQREEAFFQVMNYFKQNRPDFDRILDTEVDVSVEKEDYILVGKVDLLLGVMESWNCWISNPNPAPKNMTAGYLLTISSYVLMPIFWKQETESVRKGLCSTGQENQKGKTHS
jgi:DNA helicase-2/ATP-dependent DNA helicase PcrA